MAIARVSTSRSTICGKVRLAEVLGELLAAPRQSGSGRMWNDASVELSWKTCVCDGGAVVRIHSKRLQMSLGRDAW